MARDSRKLTLDYASRALADLESIWEWNAKQYGFSHADRYVAFPTSARLCPKKGSDALGNGAPERRNRNQQGSDPFFWAKLVSDP
jgi:hypothetical protein